MATIPRAPHTVPYRPASRHAVLDAQAQVWQNILENFPVQTPTTFRAVHITRIPRAGRLTPGESQPNLLCTTLRLAGQIPVTAIDWLLPTRTKLPTALWDYAQSYTCQLPVVSAATNPFVNTVWPLPPRAPTAQQPPITRPPLSTGVDQWFGAPGQTTTYDWPNPIPKGHAMSLRTWAQDLVGSKLVTLIPVPFKNFDQPNPLSRTLPGSLRGFADALHLNLLGMDAMPTGGPSFDYPNPQGYLYPVGLRTYINVLSYIQATPFNQDDFPNPVLGKYAMDLRTFLQGDENYLIQGIKPFYMTDYPNPKGYSYPVGTKTWTQSYVLSLIGKDQFVGAAGETKTYDYPNPLRYKTSYACYDPNFGWFIVTVPPPPPMGAISFRKTFSPVGTGVGKRQRRKDS